MKGLLNHLALTLRLNFRSPQAIVYGYLVPIFFLIAFGTLFRSGNPPLVAEMGQLLTITVLGGACFGMPTAMVAERERGVWRRYRLLPTAISSIILSTMVARFVLVLTAGVIQIMLARLLYGTTLPQRPIEMLIAFVFVSFAFLGMGLVIAMVAHTVPSVQALGQAIFLPMIIIGGVGVPLRMLTGWAQHVAAFLPGRYAVELLQACMNGRGLAGSGFQMIALVGIGLAALITATKLFRWDVDQKIVPGAAKWVGLAILTWAAVGIAAELTDQIQGPQFRETRTSLAEMITTPTTQSAQSATAPATTSFVFPYDSWRDIPKEQIDAITYDDLPPDYSKEVPVAPDLDGLDDATFARLQDFLAALKNWPPAKDPDRVQRIRALLSIQGVIDLAADPMEYASALSIFQRIRAEIPRDELAQMLTFIAITPERGQVAISAADLGVEAYAGEYPVRDRVQMYSRKLLWRVLELDKKK